VYWNLRSNPPKVAGGSTKIDGAGFTAPMVLPGSYTVKLRVKDQEYVSTIQCVHDDANNDLSLADRKLVYNKAMQLQGLYNHLNVDIDTIQYYKTKLKADSNNKANKAMLADLEKIRAELMATKQTSLFADEEKLREKVSQLYGSFCNMEAKPNEIQLKAIEALDEQYKQLNLRLNQTLNKHLPKINL
jgi:hypothetical protein